MAKQLDAWIHNFTVTDCETHKKGYTVYKITSIIFPVFVPESLTCLTVWKRYNDVKKLRKQIVRRHRELSLNSAVPPLDDDGYFRRFDADVLLARKQHILRLLDFVAQSPGLYKCHAFVQFFESSQQQSPTAAVAPLSPLKQRTQPGRIERRNSAIAAICEELEPAGRLAGSDEYNLIDPQRDAEQMAEEEARPGRRASADQSMSQSMASLSTRSSASDTSASACSEEVGEEMAAEAVAAETSGTDEVDCAVEAFAAEDEDDELAVEADVAAAVAAVGRPAVVHTADYIFEAALEFSEAVRAEVRRDNRRAFELYKSGIGLLIHGVRMDACAERRRIAKDKINKYMLRAEQIYACHLAGSTPRHTEPTHNLPTTQTQTPSKPNPLKHRSPSDRLLGFDELAHIKVLRPAHGSGSGVMLVQDTTNHGIHVLKSVEKPANFSVQLFELPARPVPGMVRLISFFVSETSVYLLLQQASGGRLFDYIRSHRSAADEQAGSSLNSLFLEPSQPVRSDESDADDVDDDAFLGTLQRLRSPTRHQTSVASDAEGEHRESDVPAFDKLDARMDVSDLLQCSQKLLALVDSTIERSNVDAEGDDDEAHGSTTTLTANLPEETDLRIPRGAPAPDPEELTPRPAAAAAIPMRTIVRWASELCRTLDDLHANGIHCGDLHARNLLLGSNGELLLSFHYPNASASATLATPRISKRAQRQLYVAPERPLSQRSDWWSFGVLLFELVTGERFVDWHPGGWAAYCEVQYPEVEGKSGVDVTAEARDLIGGCVRADVERRMDAEAIKKHAFFRDVVWDVGAEDEAEV